MYMLGTFLNFSLTMKFLSPLMFKLHTYLLGLKPDRLPMMVLA